MKTVISGFGAIVLFILCLLINTSIINFTSRSSELNIAINNAVNDTQRVLYDKSYSINSTQEYLAEFTQNLVQYINSNSEITLKVYSADENLGFLDIGVVSTYTNFSGEKREYEERRTSIIDSIAKGDESYLKDKYFISFEIKDDIKVDLSQVDFFALKEEGRKTLEIPLISGNLDSVFFHGEGNGNYSLTTKDGKNYIVIQLNDLKSDMKIIIQ